MTKSQYEAIKSLIWFAVFMLMANTSVDTAPPWVFWVLMGFGLWSYVDFRRSDRRE